MSYGFVMEVQDLTSAQMKRIEESIRSLGGTAKTETDSMNDNFGNLGNAAKDLKNTLIEVFAVREMYQFGKELLNVTAEFQGFENVIRGSSNGIVEGQQNLNYLSSAIDRLHLPMRQAYEGFSEMEAGFYGTTIQGEKLRTVFEGLSEISLTKHMQPEAFSHAIYFLKEIGELGTLQQQQLKKMSIWVPGAGAMAASAMGMTPAQLHEAMKKGEVKSEDFLPKFGSYMQKVAAPGLNIAGDSLLAQINDEKNSILKVMLDMGTSLEPFFLDILQTVSHGMEEIKKVWDSLSGNPMFINALKTTFDWAVKLIPIWLAYEVVIKALAIGTDVFIASKETLIGLIGAEGVAVETTTAAWATFNTVIETSVIGGAVVTLGLMVEHFIAMNEQLDKIIDKKFRLSQNNAFFTSQQGIAERIQEQAAVMGKLSPEAKQSLANDIAKFNKIQRDSIPLIVHRDSVLQDDASHEHPRSKWDRFFHGVGYPALWTNDGSQRIIDSANTSKQHLFDNKATADSLNKVSNILLTRFKIKASASATGDANSGISKENAYNTSNLAGASGGLGSAKIIHQHIGILQQNNGVKETKSETDKTLELLISLIGGFSDSANAQ